MYDEITCMFYLKKSSEESSWKKILIVGSASSLSLYIYIYNHHWNWVITPSWRLMRTGYHTCFHTLYDEKFEYQDSLESKITLWKDKVTLQKVGVTSWKGRNATNMDNTMKGKCPQGVCSGEGEYITHHTCSNSNELDMNPATTCDCSQEFNNLWGLRIHKICCWKQRNSHTGKCKSNDGLMNQEYHLELPKLCYHPWLAADEDRVLHVLSHV